MLTWRSWLNLMQSLSHRDQVKSLLLSGLLLLALAAGLSFMLQENPTPNEGQLLRLPASLISKAETWENDELLYTYRIRYRTPDGQTHTARSYAERIYYEASYLNSNSVLFIDIENTTNGPSIKRVITTAGMFLYDPLLEARVINTINRETITAITCFFIMGILSLLGAGVVKYRTSKS
ncbi:hypothetical protein [Pseudomonas sp. KU43P]|uniref:hypothetical protein n=1 Tax=Pseudomonas sp. KU43P TaxID=2487887 RepID=UPI0029552BFB|nr:hypothetical protein [Pseudomonas sp. KU43P]